MYFCSHSVAGFPISSSFDLNFAMPVFGRSSLVRTVVDCTGREQSISECLLQSTTIDTSDIIAAVQCVGRSMFKSA